MLENFFLESGPAAQALTASFAGEELWGSELTPFPAPQFCRPYCLERGWLCCETGRERGFSELCKVQGKSPQLCWELCGKGKFLLFPTWHRHFHPQAKKKKKKKTPQKKKPQKKKNNQTKKLFAVSFLNSQHVPPQIVFCLFVFLKRENSAVIFGNTLSRP